MQKCGYIIALRHFDFDCIHTLYSLLPPPIRRFGSVPLCKRAGTKEFPVSVSSALSASFCLQSAMSARTLKLLSEPDPSGKESECSKMGMDPSGAPAAPGPAKESVESSTPPPPPGLELSAPPGQLGKASVSEFVEDACLSSGGSTRFEEDGDVEQTAFYSQDWELSAWGQSFTYPTYSMYETGAPAPPSEGAILSTTPLCPPALAPHTPLSNAWEWSAPHEIANGLVHQPEPTFFANYGGSVQAGPELQSQIATLRSVAHESGNCKPCAFVYTKGCQSGASLPQLVVLLIGEASVIRKLCEQTIDDSCV